MRPKLVLLWIVIAALVTPSVGTKNVLGAGRPGNPLLVLSENTLYAWQPGTGLQRLYLAGSNLGVLVLSPDNQWLAYQIVSPSGNAQPSNIAPLDLHMFNLATRRDVTIFKQTLTARQIANGDYVTLTVPRWSSDGKQLAWISHTVHDPAAAVQANVYDLATRKTASRDTKLQQRDLNEIQSVFAWLDGILAVAVAPSSVVRFAADGHKLGQTDAGAPTKALIVVSQKGKLYIGAVDTGNVLHLIDPVTGALQLADGGVERYSLSAPEASLSMFANQRPDDVLKWNVVQPDGKISPLKMADLYPQAISSAGDQIAGFYNNTAYIWKDGQITPLKGTGDQGIQVKGLLWSATGWRVQPAAVNGVASMSAATLAKLPDTPLFLRIHSDLYAWTKNDKVPRRLTTRGDVSPALVSPDGKYVLYRAAPKVFGGKAFSSYRQVWLLNVSSGQSTMLDSVPDDGQDVIRMSPSWSPDSTQVAWMEMTWPGADHRLVIYDLKNHVAHVAVSGLPFPLDIFSTWMTWGDPGIAVIWCAAADREARVYSPEGKNIVSVPLGAHISIDYPMWITENGKDMLGVLSLTNPHGLQLIDPQTGKKQLSQGEIELFNPSVAADRSLSVFYANAPADSLDNWHVALPDGTTDPIHMVGGKDAIPAISPTGMEAAYAIHGQAFIYRDGEVLAVPPTGREEKGDWPQVAWGTVHYRLRQPTPAVP